MSAYATRWRFVFNPRKSNVVVVDPREQTAGLAAATAAATTDDQTWHLGGATIRRSLEYKYLGLEFGLMRTGKWVSAVQRMIHWARRRSSELLYVCNQQYGLRPRDSVKLFCSLVRPLLDYACEIWGPEIKAPVWDTLEAVQNQFCRATTGTPPSTPAPFLCSELGLPSLSARRDMLQLQYWGRLCGLSNTRLVRQLMIARHKEVPAVPPSARSRSGFLSWFQSVRATMIRYGLLDCWKGCDTGGLSYGDWTAVVKHRVTVYELTRRHQQIADLPTLKLYAAVKPKPDSLVMPLPFQRPRPAVVSVGSVNDVARRSASDPLSASSGSGSEQSEVQSARSGAADANDRESEPKDRGYLAKFPYGKIDSYLDDRVNMAGVWAKLRLLSGTLLLFGRVASQAEWPPGLQLCPLPGCNLGEVADAEHFVLRCPCFEDQRDELFFRLGADLRDHFVAGGVLEVLFNGTDDSARLAVLLGAVRHPALTEAGLRKPVPPQTAAVIDHCFRNFLLVAWKRHLHLFGDAELVASSSGDIFLRPVRVNRWGHRKNVGLPSQEKEKENNAGGASEPSSANSVLRSSARASSTRARARSQRYANRLEGI
jgi:hypothetical protein